MMRAAANNRQDVVSLLLEVKLQTRNRYGTIGANRQRGLSHCCAFRARVRESGTINPPRRSLHQAGAPWNALDKDNLAAGE